jgi:hypothetical protein
MENDHDSVESNYKDENGDTVIIFKDGTKCINSRGVWSTIKPKNTSEPNFGLNEFQRELFKMMEISEEHVGKFKRLNSREAMMFYNGKAEGIVEAIKLSEKMRTCIVGGKND